MRQWDGLNTVKTNQFYVKMSWCNGQRVRLWISSPGFDSQVYHFIFVFILSRYSTDWVNSQTVKHSFYSPMFCFVFSSSSSSFFWDKLLHCPWFTTNSRPIIPPRAILYYALWALYMEYGIGFWSYIHTHCRMEIQCCRPTNWPVYRLDQGPKLCNCSPTRGLHDMMDFKSLGI